MGFYMQNMFSTEDGLFNNSNYSKIFIHMGGLVLYIDMTFIKSGEHRILLIGEDFERPTEDDISQYNRNQNSFDIKRIIESHNAKWIPYQPRKSLNSNQFGTDDHTISSIERI